MKQRKWTVAVAVAGLALAAGVGVAGVANAGAVRAAIPEAGGGNKRGDEARELATFKGAGISLTQAITAAETRTGLRAMEAGIDDEGRGALYEVSVTDGTGEKTVLVDTQSGKVTSVVADAEEADDAD